MVQTFSDEENIYSVDMMIAYINLFNPEVKHLKVKHFLDTLEDNVWGEPEKDIEYSPLDVLKNPDKYKRETRRIKRACLKYPIIVVDDYIVDGVHRLTKAYLRGKKYIRAYVFTKEELDKFIIDNKLDWDNAYSLDINDFIELFCKRFVSLVHKSNLHNEKILTT